MHKPPPASCHQHPSGLQASARRGASTRTPTHNYIENTLASIGAAFDLGATIVEIDIRRTADDQLVIFHDYQLECRTDGHDEVGDHPLAYLQGLDIGYGYTHDGGQTYPLRGQGLGLMPTLIQVLEAYPEDRFLIDHKDGSLETAELLVDIVENLPPEQQAHLYYWGPDGVYQYIHSQLPAITRRLAIRPTVKKCLYPYLLSLGVAGFPQECRGVGFGLPPEYLKFAWGWPYRFLERVSAAGMRFYLLIDSEQGAAAFADLPIDGIVTDYVELVGPNCNR
jgi:glycerophosphoryl diester phosphodiesterase